MKKVSICAIYLANEESLTGVQRVSREIILRMDKLLSEYPGLEIEYLYPNKAENKIICPSEFSNIKAIEVADSKQLDMYNQLACFPRYIKKNNSKALSISFEYVRSKGSIATIHDLRPLIFKKYDKFAFRMKYRFMLNVIKKNASKILTVSEYQKNDIVKYLHVEPNRIDVFYNGWEHMNEIFPDNDIFDKCKNIKKNEYFYALGSLAPHKNFKWIIEVAKRNPDKMFVIAGGKNLRAWKDDIETDEFKNIIFPGYVSDGENKALMQNCKAFLFPSKYEGFGIPPLEALACGAPIIISNATCLPEIYEDCAHYFDPDNYNVDLDEMLKEKVGSSEKILKKCSWDVAAKKVIELLLE